MVVNNAASKIQRPLTNRERFYDELPWFVRCSLDKGELSTRSRADAQHYPYIQANRADMRSWMIFDLDHENAYIWQDSNLPPPNMIVSNKNNGRSHLYYAIEPVYLGDKARSKPINYFNAIYKRMRKMLNADPAFGQFISKTPYSEFFRTLDLHHQEYTLGELADYVDFEESTWLQRKGRLLRDESMGRNCAIFDELRYYAYSIVDKFRLDSNELGFYKELMAYAESANEFSDCGQFDDISPLALNELRSIVKSVSKWTFANYEAGSGSKKANRGVMMLFKENMSLNEKQSKSASRTNDMRCKGTQSAIIDATWRFLSLQDETPCKPCMTSIAKLASVSRQTAYKYRSIITEIFEKSQPTRIVSLTSLFHGGSVNYGSYQLLAPLGGSFILKTFTILNDSYYDPSNLRVGFLGWFYFKDVFR